MLQGLCFFLLNDSVLQAFKATHFHNHKHNNRSFCIAGTNICSMLGPGDFKGTLTKYRGFSAKDKVWFDSKRSDTAGNVKTWERLKS